MIRIIKRLFSNLKRDTPWAFFMEIILFRFYLIAVVLWVVGGLIMMRIGWLSQPVFVVVTMAVGVPCVVATIVNIGVMIKILIGIKRKET